MLRIIVDSGSSIKEAEKEKYGVDILPLGVQIGEDSYQDGQTLTVDNFYGRLRASKSFPKTSLPSLMDARELVKRYIAQGDHVLIITISSGISGTWQALKLAMQDEPNVAVFDSKLAVGGVRFLVEEARRYENEPLDVIVQKLDALVPRIVIAAIPETLDYLLAGGRLSRAGWMMGKLLAIHPVIGFVDGKVSVVAKKRGMKASLQYLADVVVEQQSDPQYGIIAAYTENQGNIEQVIGMTDPEYQKQVKLYDNLTPSIACHWGPNAFGYIFVKKAADRI